MRNFIMPLCFALLCCTSKVKEGADLTVYNGTRYDVFLIDKYTLDNLDRSKNIQIFTEGFINSNTKKTRPYLNPEYITMYTNKTIFFPLKDFNNNKKDYNSLTFYFIKKENLGKTKQQIVKNKLYDSIKINLGKFHQEGSDNHVYLEENKIEFKSY